MPWSKRKGIDSGRDGEIRGSGSPHLSSFFLFSFFLFFFCKENINPPKDSLCLIKRPRIALLQIEKSLVLFRGCGNVIPFYPSDTCKLDRILGKFHEHLHVKRYKDSMRESERV